MVIFEIIGEVVTQIFLESIVCIPGKIRRWIAGKDARFNGYSTEQKRFINFAVANKFLLTWEADIEHLRYRRAEGLETMNEKITVTDFRFKTIDERTIILPPMSISFTHSTSWYNASQSTR